MHGLLTRANNFLFAGKIVCVVIVPFVIVFVGAVLVIRRPRQDFVVFVVIVSLFVFAYFVVFVSISAPFSPSPL